MNNFDFLGGYSVFIIAIILKITIILFFFLINRKGKKSIPIKLKKAVAEDEQINDVVWITSSTKDKLENGNPYEDHLVYHNRKDCPFATKDFNSKSGSFKNTGLVPYEKNELLHPCVGCIFEGIPLEHIFSAD